MYEKKCEKCDAIMKDHQWGKHRAQKNGWFQQKDGKNFCPKHVPEWVETWRTKKAVE